MECEDEFGIKIPDAEASHVRTMADLHVLICKLLEGKENGEEGANPFGQFIEAVRRGAADGLPSGFACVED